MKQITIEITTGGEVIIEAHGFKGATCEKATQAMEEALGKPTNRKRKPEYQQDTVNRQRA